MKQIGAICQEWRQEQKITQNDISISLNVSRSLIALFESGRVNNAKILVQYLALGLDQHLLLDAVYEVE